MAHTVNLATWKAEIEKISVRGQIRQRVYETPISNKSWVMWHVPVIPALAESVNHGLPSPK
jgi:hypothetical protein